MYLIYSLLLTASFILMLPLFILRREKYAAGFWQRLGYHPEFKHDNRPVIWLHCVSVGETNAARPLVEQLKLNFPDLRLVVSTTTKTGQELAKSIFRDQADTVFYFPFDWKFSVRRAFKNFRPEIVLLMETEIWFNFFNEADKSGVKLVIVNGRLSEKSANRYSHIKRFIGRVLNCVDLALMQGEADAKRILSLGINANKVKVTGNLKFDHGVGDGENALTHEFRQRFGISSERPLIIAASTHKPEEAWIMAAFVGVATDLPEARPRLLIAPRHPERFEEVANLVSAFCASTDCEWRDFKFVRRSEAQRETDKIADVTLLDSIGELRAVYPLAEIVFIGGSLIPHGGQSILEPAAAGRAIVTGPFTQNFEAVVNDFLANKALIQLSEAPQDSQTSERLSEVFIQLLEDVQKRDALGENALSIMQANRGATAKTIENLKPLLYKTEK